jgi:hypothetical protein
MARPGLPNEVRAFIVQSLACFDSLGTIREAVKKEFGHEVTPQAIEAYDPTKKAGRNLSPQWREMFETARKAFLADITPIAISHRAVRLRTLQRMAAKAEEMRNLPLAASLLEQAAKEVGEAYTNRQKHEHTGKDGKDLPAPPAPVTIFQLPDNGRS